MAVLVALLLKTFFSLRCFTTHPTGTSAFGKLCGVKFLYFNRPTPTNSKLFVSLLPNQRSAEVRGTIFFMNVHILNLKVVCSTPELPPFQFIFKASKT